MAVIKGIEDNFEDLTAIDSSFWPGAIRVA